MPFNWSLNVCIFKLALDLCSDKGLLRLVSAQGLLFQRGEEHTGEMERRTRNDQVVCICNQSCGLHLLFSLRKAFLV